MVTQNGSLLTTNDGLGKGLSAAGLPVTKVMPHSDSPDNIVTGLVGSALVLDVDNGELYMCEAQGGSEWIRLVSGT